MRLFPADDTLLFWEAVFLSLSLHVLFFLSQRLPIPLPRTRPVEIDITNMGSVRNTLSAPRPAAPPKPAAPVKQWIAPAPNQKPVLAAIPTKPVAPEPEPPPAPAPAGPPNGEYSIGTGEGGETALSRLPQLLNLSELSAILRRYYPEEARREGREATVVMDIHINTDGQVTAVDIVRSGGPDFDAAAQKVGKLLRFTPAYLGSQRVGVKMRQAIQFRLTDDDEQ